MAMGVNLEGLRVFPASGNVTRETYCALSVAVAMHPKEYGDESQSVKRRLDQFKRAFERGGGQAAGMRQA